MFIHIHSLCLAVSKPSMKKSTLLKEISRLGTFQEGQIYSHHSIGPQHRHLTTPEDRAGHGVSLLIFLKKEVRSKLEMFCGCNPLNRSFILGISP